MRYFKLLIIAMTLSVCACTTTPGENDSDSEEQLEIAREQFMRKDYESSAITLMPLVRDNNSDAQYSLGYLYYYGMGVPRNVNYGRQLMQSAAQQGNQRALEALVLLSRQTATLGPSAAHPPHSPDKLMAD